MTVIIALKDNDNKCVYFGADTQGTRGDMSSYWGNKIISLPLKIVNNQGDTVRVDTLYIGVSGSHYLQQFFEYCFHVPVMNVNDNFFEYYYNNFQKTLIDYLSEHQLLLSDKGVSDNESTILIIYNGSIYRITTDFSMMEEEVFYCIGTGWDVATAVVTNYLLHHNDSPYEDIIMEALLTTGELNVYCSKDFNLIKIEY